MSNYFSLRYSKLLFFSTYLKAEEKQPFSENSKYPVTSSAVLWLKQTSVQSGYQGSKNYLEHMHPMYMYISKDRASCKIQDVKAYLEKRLLKQIKIATYF